MSASAALDEASMPEQPSPAADVAPAPAPAPQQLVASSEESASQQPASQQSAAPVEASESQQPAASEEASSASQQLETSDVNTSQPTDPVGDTLGLTAMLSGWGFGGTSGSQAASADDPEIEPETPASDAELKAMAANMETAAASAASVATETAAAAAASLTTALGDFWGSSSSTAEETGDAPTEEDIAKTAGKYLEDLTKINPSQWIDDLERENEQNDPHRKLKEFLDAYLEVWPRATYEEWIEECLVKMEGWDEGSAVVDESFYMEKSVHRNLWNERNLEDGIDADGGTDAKRAYVPARSPNDAKDEDDHEEIVFVSPPEDEENSKE